MGRNSVGGHLTGEGSAEQAGKQRVTSLSREVHALLVCAKVVVGSSELNALQTALAVCPSVECLCETAVKHRMLGHLHKAVISSPTVTIDQALEQRLDELQNAAIMRSLRQTGQLLRVLGALEAAGVKAIPFKGPVWAQVLYGDSTLRNFTDLDLLVASEQALAARRVLLDEGFADVDPLNSKVLGERLRMVGQIALQKPQSHLFLDLHWRINVALGRRSLDFASVRSRATTVGLLGRDVPCPGRFDTFLVTCLAGIRERWDTVGRLLDLSVQIQRMSEKDWTELLTVAGLQGCRRRVLVSVDHVCRTLGIRLPSIPGDWVRSDYASRFLARALNPRLLEEGPTGGSWRRTVYFLWSLATEDRAADFFLQFFARLFLPTSEDWKFVSFPRWLEWLYYPLRPLRLTVKWAKRAFRPRPDRSQG